MSDGQQARHAVILLDSPESRFGGRRPSFHQGQHPLGKQRKLARLVSHRPEMHSLAADSCIPNEQIDAMLGRTYAHPRSELVNTRPRARANAASTRSASLEDSVIHSHIVPTA